METETLSNLIKEYRNAPKEFQATSYWDSYENEILDTIPSIDLTQLRSGKYPILGTFGFYDEILSLSSKYAFLAENSPQSAPPLRD